MINKTLVYQPKVTKEPLSYRSQHRNHQQIMKEKYTNNPYQHIKLDNQSTPAKSINEDLSGPLRDKNLSKMSKTQE